MTSAEIVLETLVYTPFNHMTLLFAQELIEFSHRERFKL
jgi:hypothetical protein